MKSQFSPPATPVIPTIPTLGIDFGTSNSKMAWYNPKLNAPDIIKNGDDDQTPSVVYFGKDEHFVGKDAVEMLEDENECIRVCENIKLDMERGNFFTDEKIYEPWEVVTEILSKLKHIAEDRA